MTDKLITVRLNGTLGEKHGKVHKLCVNSPAEAVRALMQMDGFREELSEGYYRLRVRQTTKGEEGLQEYFREQDTSMSLTPVAYGAGGRSRGIGKIILGTVIIIAAVVAAPLSGGTSLVAALGTSSAFLGITYGSVALFGASVLLAGVASVLTPTPGVTNLSREETDAKPGFLFSGGGFTQTEQGGPVPLIFGEVALSGLVISAGLEAERI